MPATAAQIAANRANSQKSTGPKTPEGKASSRQNGLKHGLTGEGIVTPEADEAEIARRIEGFTADMKPQTPAGVVLIVQMATLSVRMERAGQQELAALAMHVRHAAEDFDEERIERANSLFESLGEDPRNNLRKLKKMPEGVDRLVDDWQDLRNDLLIEPKPLWTADHLERAAHMSGLKTQHARGSEFGALSKSFWGDLGALEEDDEADPDEQFHQEFAKAQLIERIDAEIAALEAHRETLDFEMIEFDRAGASQRALFDGSKEATLARRYESEARRGFYKALKEFRQIEEEAAARMEESEACPPPSKLGSSCYPTATPAREPRPGFADASPDEFPVVQGTNALPKVPVSPVKLPG